MKFELYLHELVSHDELLAHERFVVRSEENSEIIGVKLACPTCNSNQFVLSPATFRYNVQDASNVRSYHGHRSTIVPFGAPP